jgi:hypothetical protein
VAKLVIPGTGVIISVEYAADGLAWARLYDNQVLGWYVDTEPPITTPEGSTTPLVGPPIAPGASPVPVILGHLLAPPPATMPIVSPQWANYVEPNVFVPDIWRGTVEEFFAWLATNNGAQRPLGSRLLSDTSLQHAFAMWAHHNPDISFAGDPPA